MKCRNGWSPWAHENGLCLCGWTIPAKIKYAMRKARKAVRKVRRRKPK